MNLWQIVTVFFLLFCSYFLPSSQQHISYHSFTEPFGLQTWSLGGDAQLTETFIRLAEDRQSKKGWLWNNMPSTLTDWEATITFRIHGVSKLGADGMAFWYTQNSKQTGNLFGGEERFRGIGVLIDTYDNDNSGLHPYLSLVVNDGTRAFAHDHDGKTGYQKGGCQIKARNLPLPSTIRILYQHRLISMWYTEPNGTPKPCVVNVPLDIPTGYYFGFSAATGHLADNHDLHGFSVVNLDPNHPPIPPIELPFGRVLNSIFVSHRDSASTIEDQQKLIMSKVDQLNSALQSLNVGIRNEVRPSGGAPTPFQAPVAYVRDSAYPKECSSVLQSISSVQKSLEKIEKDQQKRISDLKSETTTASSTKQQKAQTTSSIIDWVNVFLLFGLIVFFVINEVIKMNVRSKKYF